MEGCLLASDGARLIRRTHVSCFLFLLESFFFFGRDASGMTLEMEAIETSLVKLAPSGWTPSIAYDKDADEVRVRVGGFGGSADSLGGFDALML